MGFNLFKRKSQEEVIRQKIQKAWKNLIRKQPNIFGLTPDSVQTEWNIVHHFANELQRLYRQYDCDIDLIKPSEGRRRPDIVLHKRGNHTLNFLVVEVKQSIDGVEDDVLKINNHWFYPPLSYQYGAVFAYNSDYISVIKNRTIKTN